MATPCGPGPPAAWRPVSSHAPWPAPLFRSIRPGRAARLTRSGGKPLPARADWRPAGAALVSVAPNSGVVPEVAVGSLVIAALAAAVLVAANALAAGPALLAARSRPARLLRAK